MATAIQVETSSGSSLLSRDDMPSPSQQQRKSSILRSLSLPVRSRRSKRGRARSGDIEPGLLLSPESNNTAPRVMRAVSSSTRGLLRVYSRVVRHASSQASQTQNALLNNAC